jgi:hypothetical protein
VRRAIIPTPSYWPARVNKEFKKIYRRPKAQKIKGASPAKQRCGSMFNEEEITLRQSVNITATSAL